MKIEISTQELMELRGQLFAPLDARIRELERKRDEELKAYRTLRNSLGMSGEQLADKVASLTVERITAAIAANQEAEETEDDSEEALAARISEMVARRVAVLVAETRTPSADEEPTTQAPASIEEDAEEVVTLGDVLPHVSSDHPEYPNQIVSPEPATEPEDPGKDVEEAAPVEVTIYPHGQKIIGMPAWDESAGVYIVGGNGFIGRDIWNKPEYRSWFNDEIRQLRAEGRSLQYIADRVKVSVQTVRNRMENYKIS